MRQEFPKRVKLAAWERSLGRCEGCAARLFPGKYHYHHDKADTLGGEPKLENCRVLCIACHGVITKGEAPVIAKSNRVRNRHLGIRPRRRTIPGRKFNGEPIPARWK